MIYYEGYLVKKAAFKGVTILFSILFAISFIILPVNAAMTWTTEKVVDDSKVGEGCSLALDSAGNPWISYNVNNELRVAHFTGATWEKDLVDTSGDRVSAIAINAAGNPVIVYQDSFNGSIEYAERVGTTWKISTVDADCPLSSGMSMALDSAGCLHAAYIQSLPPLLKYASQTISTWSIEEIDDDCPSGDYPSIQMDSDGNPCICYYNATSSALLYLRKVGGSWLSETVQSTVGYIQSNHQPSLKLRSDGQPGVSYYMMDLKKVSSLYYSYRDDGGWHSQLVDSQADLGAYSSLAFDRWNTPHISYNDVTNRDLKYAYYDGTSWQVTTVDSEGNVGEYSSLALGSDGNPQVCYIDATNSALKFAYVNSAVKFPLVTPESDGVGVLLFSVLVGAGCYVVIKKRN